MARRWRVNAHELADSILVDARHEPDFRAALEKRLSELHKQDAELAEGVRRIINLRLAYKTGAI